MLWLAFICLTAVIVAIVAWPLVSAGAVDHATGGETGRRAVYLDQLSQIDADVSRGTLAASEGEAARIEISRRLLADAGTEPSGTTDSALPLAARLAIVAAIPFIAFGLYGRLGAPQLPGKPFAEVVAQGTGAASDLDAMVTRVEARLRETPQDGRGWDALAPVYLRMRRYDDARFAFTRAIELEGETSKRLAGLAESAVRAGGGMVTDDARVAYEKLLKLEPDRLEARFFLALAKEQRGELAQAADDYRAILAVAPADAPWKAAVEERLTAVAAAVAPQAPVPGKGPTAAEMEAAQKLSAEERQQMATQMVDRLHQRLKGNGKDAAGWQMLLRAYGVQGERAKAVAALAEARKALEGDAQGLAAVDALARELGLGS